jgi:hypothetical protein
LTPPDPQLKGAWYPGGFNPCTYQVKSRFQTLLSKCNLHRYTAVTYEHDYRGKKTNKPVLPSDHFGLLVTLKPK